MRGEISDPGATCEPFARQFARRGSYRRPVPELPLTGERTVPGIPAENYWFRRHEAAYEFALSHVRGRVLEVGCGEGYGTAVLATAADAVLGIDYDQLTIAHATAR